MSCDADHVGDRGGNGHRRSADPTTAGRFHQTEPLTVHDAVICDTPLPLLVKSTLYFSTKTPVRLCPRGHAAGVLYALSPNQMGPMAVPASDRRP
ncbi:hypothetical protein Pen02_18710 [Plantactinospora endophytica]|uniref:Uncharacterized protein n=1 Tax=Plantactinospora endophytica TaxID=673535 RepID=A0ABQ4DWV8_9ACTN|nr:hypothetical protein Pen02_18710 [Plantactinospora endophytica]